MTTLREAWEQGARHAWSQSNDCGYNGECDPDDPPLDDNPYPGPRAQLLVFTSTREGRYVTRIYDRKDAEVLMSTIQTAMAIGRDGTDSTAVVTFETFHYAGATVTLDGSLILGVELVPIDPKHTTTYRPGPDTPTLGTHSPMFQ